MERIVLDTNCLVQILSSSSEYNNIWQKINSDEVILCVTTEILNEYSEILTRYIGHQIAERIVEIILFRPYTQLITNYYHWNLITMDPDDNKFVDCAITANAKFIVTEDKHFNILKTTEFPHVDLMRLKEYSEHIKESLL